MAEAKYKDYLAARILTESQPVTYKLLSRALQVNVNVAKWMLFDFHQKQNAKKANSIHATYLISGTRLSAGDANGANGRSNDDTGMRSSPFMSSMPQHEEQEVQEPVKKSTILLVREEELAKTRAEFSEEASIHVYSLGPGPLENLNILASCNREVISKHADKDPLERWRAYGSIRNPYIKRRTAKYAPIAAAAAAPVAVPTKATVNPTAKPPVAAQLRKEASTSSRRGSASEDNTSGRSTPQPSAASNTLKRSESTKSAGTKNKTAGDIFKSFAKAKPKPKDAARSNESTPAPLEDEPMQGMSEDEGDDEAPEVQVDTAKIEAARKARDERAEKLRKMMEDDDDDMPDAIAAEEKPSEAEQFEKPNMAKQDEPEPAFVVENGRRRGKRRVMKKKTVKDEEGYLVTKEEAVWESFSEDEPEPKRTKAAPKPVATGKGKLIGKKGQGSIASFFKKA